MLRTLLASFVFLAVVQAHASDHAELSFRGRLTVSFNLDGSPAGASSAGSARASGSLGGEHRHEAGADDNVFTNTITLSKFNSTSVVATDSTAKQSVVLKLKKSKDGAFTLTPADKFWAPISSQLVGQYDSYMNGGGLVFRYSMHLGAAKCAHDATRITCVGSYSGSLEGRER